MHYKRRDGDTRHGDERIVVVRARRRERTYSWERAALDPLAERLGAAAVARRARVRAHRAASDLARYTARTTRPSLARCWTWRSSHPAAPRKISARESETYENKTWNDVVRDETSQADGPVSEKKKKKKAAACVVVGHSMGGVAAAVAAAEGDVDDVVVAPAVIAAPPGNEKTRGNAAGPAKKPPGRAARGGARAPASSAAFAASPVLTLARKLCARHRFGATGSAGRGAAAAARVRADATWADGYRRPSAVAGWDAGMVGSCCRRPPGA